MHLTIQFGQSQWARPVSATIHHPQPSAGSFLSRKREEADHICTFGSSFISFNRSSSHYQLPLVMVHYRYAAQLFFTVQRRCHKSNACINVIISQQFFLSTHKSNTIDNIGYTELEARSFVMKHISLNILVSHYSSNQRVAIKALKKWT